MYNFKLNSLIYKKTGSNKKYCQDYVNARTFPNGISVVALADGLGSKKKSDIGARIAVETTIEKIGTLLSENDINHLNPNDIASNLLLDIKSKIVKLAGSEDIKDYSSTLLFYAIKENTMIIGQIGDGYIAVKKKNSDFKLVFSPKNDDIEVNHTETIFSKSKYMNLAKCNVKDIDYIFISSDGTDKLKRNNFAKTHSYTPFITSKKYNRKPQVPIFNTLSLILKDTSNGFFKVNNYSLDIIKAMQEMLVINVPDDDVTFAFTRPNTEGVSYRVVELLEAISKNS